MARRPDTRPDSAPPAADLAAVAAALRGDRPDPPGLYVVATPIGNLADVTLRAIRVLAQADVIACEDTRVTRRLLERYGIRTRLVSYHDHNAEARRPELIARLAAGGRVAQVTDAGTPLVSDPGFRLVAAAIAAGHPVFPVPGPSALMAGLVTAGLPTDRFWFEGFLPARAAARRARIAELAALPGTLVVFEAPQRTAAALADLAAGLGGARPAALARELTKRFETVVRGTLADLAAAFAASPPKGEIVLVIGAAPQAADRPEVGDLDARLAALVAAHGVSRAAALLAAETGLKRADLYRRALALAGGGCGDDA